MASAAAVATDLSREDPPQKDLLNPDEELGVEGEITHTDNPMGSPNGEAASREPQRTRIEGKKVQVTEITPEPQSDGEKADEDDEELDENLFGDDDDEEPKQK